MIILGYLSYFSIKTYAVGILVSTTTYVLWRTGENYPRIIIKGSLRYVSLAFLIPSLDFSIQFLVDYLQSS